MVRSLSLLILGAFLCNLAQADFYRIARPGESVQNIVDELLFDHKTTGLVGREIGLNFSQVRQLVQMTNLTCPTNKIRFKNDSFILSINNEWKESSHIQVPTKLQDSDSQSAATLVRNYVSFYVEHELGTALFNVSSNGKIIESEVSSMGHTYRCKSKTEDYF